MSSSVPYIGSKISLISKSKIRYEGILHSIDTAQSTVTLENVRSFGTEGRLGFGKEDIMGTDQIYDLIIFRGSDIQDLQVCEVPQQRPPVPQVPPHDPAIVSGPPGYPNFNPLTNPYGINPQHMNPYHFQMMQQQYQYWQQHFQNQSNGMMGNPLDGNMPMMPPFDTSLSYQNQQPAVGQPNNAWNTSPRGPSPVRTALDKHREAQKPVERKPEDKKYSKPTHDITEQQPKGLEEAKNAPSSQINENSRKSNEVPSNNGENYRNRNNNYQPRGSYRGRGGRRGGFSGGRGIVVPDSEFDFQVSNAKFNKDEEKKDEAVQSKPVVPVYDKQKSFFDDISCETKEREQAKEEGKYSNPLDRKAKQLEERRLNLETFGQMQAFDHRRGGRGRGRGYRGNRGGYYRGGYNNNRGNYNSNSNNQRQESSEIVEK